MSVGPEPPITLKGCGESFTNQKVVLSNNLDCGSLVGDQQLCALTLDGPLAELDCNDKTLSQITSPPYYDEGPFLYGICLKNGAKARNCNVEQFGVGLDVRNDNNNSNSEGEVVNCVLNSNNFGIQALFNSNSTLTIENT